MSGIDRKEILRRDCKRCKGHGYINPTGTLEELCETCAGSGQQEKEVEFKFDGPRSSDELADIWGDNK